MKMLPMVILDLAIPPVSRSPPAIDPASRRDRRRSVAPYGATINRGSLGIYSVQAIFALVALCRLDAGGGRSTSVDSEPTRLRLDVLELRSLSASERARGAPDDTSGELRHGSARWQPSSGGAHRQRPYRRETVPRSFHAARSAPGRSLRRVAHPDRQWRIDRGRLSPGFDFRPSTAHRADQPAMPGDRRLEPVNRFVGRPSVTGKLSRSVLEVWSHDEALARRRHPIGTKARLALDLFLYTGVRNPTLCAWAREWSETDGCASPKRRVTHAHRSSASCRSCRSCANRSLPLPRDTLRISSPSSANRSRPTGSATGSGSAAMRSAIALFGARAAQGRCDDRGGERRHRASADGNLWLGEPEAGRALHPPRGPEATGWGRARAGRTRTEIAQIFPTFSPDAGRWERIVL